MRRCGWDGMQFNQKICKAMAGLVLAIVLGLAQVVMGVEADDGLHRAMRVRNEGTIIIQDNMAEKAKALAANSPVKIAVIGGTEVWVGNRAGTFYGTYLNKKIEVFYGLNNIKVYKGKRVIRGEEWYSYLYADKGLINGRNIYLVGRWKDQKTFEAYKIYLPPDIKKIEEC